MRWMYQMVFFDEDDIRKELEEMGYTPNRKLIADLRKGKSFNLF